MKCIVLFCVEAVRAIQALENVHDRLQRQGNHVFDENIMRMKHTLNSPLLRQLLGIQASCKELNHKISTAKGDTISDFEFSQEGGLITIPARQLRLDKDRARATSNSVTQVESSFHNHFEDDRADLFQRLLPVAQGRDMETIVLSKPERGGLGFSVVGLKSENKGELGIFIQDVQTDGVAAR